MQLHLETLASKPHPAEQAAEQTILGDEFLAEFRFGALPILEVAPLFISPRNVLFISPDLDVLDSRLSTKHADGLFELRTRLIKPRILKSAPVPQFQSSR